MRIKSSDCGGRHRPRLAQAWDVKSLPLMPAIGFGEIQAHFKSSQRPSETNKYDTCETKVLEDRASWP